MSSDDQHFMSVAIDLARKGAGRTSPNPMVGAVVVKKGKIVGKGYHQRAGGNHAEVNAILDAGKEVKGSTLYVSLEPCNHIGRTPPCTEAILESGIHRVVAAMEDPNPSVSGGGMKFLQEKGISTVVGILEKQACLLNEAFIKFVRTGLPFVTIKCAATLDGRLATRTGDSKWVTGKISREYVHRMRNETDAILVGVDTVKRDDPLLTTRVEGPDANDPIRIVLDSRFSIPDTARILNLESESDTLIVIGKKSSDSDITLKRERVERTNVKVLEIPTEGEGIEWTPLLKRLGEMEVTSLLIEGGGKVIGSALRSRIADKLVLFFAPKLLAGDDGTPICSGRGPETMADALRLQNMKFRRSGEDIMVEGYLENVYRPN